MAKVSDTHRRVRGGYVGAKKVPRFLNMKLYGAAGFTVSLGIAAREDEKNKAAIELDPEKAEEAAEELYELAELARERRDGRK